MTKSWIGSRTNKFGGSLAILGIAVATLPELQNIIHQLPSEYQGYIVLVIGIIVMVLRHITTGPISTNVKATESENMVTNILNHIGFLEAILVHNEIKPREIGFDMEIEEPWLRDIYTVWNVMEQTRKLRKG